MWLVSSTGYTDEVDSFGNFTGVKIESFSTPVQVELSIYPVNGEIRRTSMGKFDEADYLAVSTDIVLKEDDLLYYDEPTGDYDTSYDFKVMKINSSLNSYRYELESRT